MCQPDAPESGGPRQKTRSEDLDVVELDLAGNIVSAAARRRCLLGNSAQAIAGRNISEYLKAQTGLEIRRWLDAIACHGPQPGPAVIVFETCDGRGVARRADCAFRRDDDGRLVGVTLRLGRTVADRAGGTAPCLSGEHLDLAERVAGFGLWETDLFSGGTVWSAGTYRLHGLTPDGFSPSLGSYPDLVAPEDWSEVSDGLRRLSQGEPVAVLEYRIIRPNGDRRSIHSEWRVERDADDGAVARLFGMLHDVTERECNVSALRDRDARLLAAEAHAEQCAVAKSRFLSAASHDLRQPLQAAILFQSILGKRNRDPALREIIAKSGEVLGNLQDMLHGILELSKLEAGDVEVHKQVFPLGDLMRQVAAEARPAALAAGLVLRIVPTRQRVVCDPHLLGRMMQNLLSNAIKHTERGRVLMGCRRTGQGIRLQIWDTGKGIPHEQHEAIFREFYSFGIPARGGSNGLGLGLAIVGRLARMLDCPVRLRSWPGRGTVFEMVVPLAESLPAVQSPSASLPAAEDPFVNDAVIVLIDDEEQVLEALAQFLESLGHAVVAATSAEDAIDRLRALDQSPQVILADYRLHAEQTGTAAIHSLQNAFGAAIPGILLTGDTSPERLKEARRSGFQLLHKPIKPDELIEAVNQWL